MCSEAREEETIIKHPFHRLITALFIGALAVLVACSQEDIKPELPASESVAVDAPILDYTGEVTNLSGSRGNRKYYSVTVPAGASNLQVRISGGSGDADLYVAYGDGVSTSTYDCRPYLNGNNETCTFASPQTGTYSIMIRAYRSYSGLTLRVSYDEPSTPPPGDGTLENGVPVTGLSGAQGEESFFTLQVPSGASDLVFDLSGGSGDADLYVRYGAKPTTSSYTCRPYLNGNDEACTFANPQAGTYHVMLRGYRAYSGASLVGSFDTGGTEPPPPSGGAFDIVFVFGPNVTSAQKTLFQNAAARWEEVITGDLPDSSLNKSANACGQNEPAYSGSIDDVVIYAEVGPRDGPGGVLASAGPCYIRSASQGSLTSYGVMNFDEADSSGPDLYETILHEMGHVLGIGTLWTTFNLVNYSSGCPTTPRYSGPSARTEWQAFGGSGDVPVEDGGGSGTRCGHWDEETFDSELMTGYSEGSAAEQLSRMTAGTLEDMGYSVNKSASDAYSLPSCSPACASVTTQSRDLAAGEILLRPVGVSYPDGSVRPFKTDN